MSSRGQDRSWIVRIANIGTTETCCNAVFESNLENLFVMGLCYTKVIFSVAELILGSILLTISCKNSYYTKAWYVHAMSLEYM